MASAISFRVQSDKLLIAYLVVVSKISEQETICL